MTSIAKRSFVIDGHGRVVSATVEHLVDDGRGATTVTRSTRARRCAGCWRVVTTAAEVAGLCAACGRGPLCRSCETKCGVCGRGLCSRCRRGFVWGRSPIATCPRCFGLLNRRAIYEQRLQERRFGLESALRLRQERMRGLALRLQALRMGVTSGDRGNGHRH